MIYILISGGSIKLKLQQKVTKGDSEQAITTLQWYNNKL